MTKHTRGMRAGRRLEIRSPTPSPQLQDARAMPASTGNRRPIGAHPCCDVARLKSSRPGKSHGSPPSVKRRPASSPHMLFLGLPSHVLSVVRAILEVLLSLLFALSGGTRRSRRRRVVRKSGRRQLSHDVDGPRCVKEIHALAAPDSVNSIHAWSCGVYPARWYTAGGSGRIRCASYATSSRHLA